MLFEAPPFVGSLFAWIFVFVAAQDLVALRPRSMQKYEIINVEFQFLGRRAPYLLPIFLLSLPRDFPRFNSFLYLDPRY